MRKRGKDFRFFRLGMLVIALFAALSCQGGGPRVQWQGKIDGRARECLHRGLLQNRMGDLASAEESFKRAISLDENFLEAHRQYQNVKLVNFRRGEVILEYRRWLDKRRKSPLFYYLYGRAIQDPLEKKRAFSAALSMDPSFFWAHLGLAFLFEKEGQYEDAFPYYKSAMELEPDRPEPFLRAGLILWRWGKKKEAEECLLKAFPAAEKEGTFLAHTAFFYGREGEGLRALDYGLLALSRSPEDPFTREVLTELLEKYGSREHFWKTIEILNRLIRENPKDQVPPGFHEMRAFSYQNLGDFVRAASLYEKSYSLGNRSVRLIRALRKLYAGLGRYEDVVRIWKPTVPVERILSSSSGLSDRFQALFRSTENAMQDPHGREALLSLARAYRDVGWLEEAGEIYGRLRLLHSGDSRIERETARLVQCEEVIRNLQVYFKNKYLRAQNGETGDTLEGVLKDVYGIAEKATGIDFKSNPSPVRHYPFLGSMTLPWGEAGGALEAFLNSFNFYLIIGKREGGNPEALLLKGLVWEREQSRRAWNKDVHFDLFLGEEPLISGLRDFSGDRVAGITFEDSIFVLLDRLQDQSAEAREILERAGPLGERLFSDPLLSAAEPGGAVSLGSPLFLREKLLHLFLTRWQGERREGKGREWEGSPFLDMVEWHEVGHMVDVRQYIPLEKNIFRNLWFALRNGFSPSRIEAELEGRAQVTSLAFCKNPHLALASLVGFLPFKDSSPPHSRGYYRVSEEFVSYLYENRKNFAAIQDDFPILEQLHLLSGDEIRSIALEVGKRMGL